MHSHSYLNTAKKIIQLYNGEVPLASWLKRFFKTDKKYGSKDRKAISNLCYCFYRLGGSFESLDFDKRIITALFLCSNSSNKILEELRPEWSQKITYSLDEKIKELRGDAEIQKIFPLLDQVSNEIDLKRFNLSFLIQPDLFLRIRPGKKNKVVYKLRETDIKFSLLNDDCIQLSNQSKLDEVLNIDEDVVIQDYNSQRTIELFENSKPQTPNSKLSVWDCCAASGGKSILFHDHFPEAQLTVSDVRESILINLHNRFKKAGINSYNSFVADISSPDFSAQKKFDLIICDAPCSGSGTWSRTPEQLYFFKKEKIDYYSHLQKKIVSNASEAVKKNGFFLYITCSVFTKENEEVVEYIQSNLLLQPIATQYFNGYDKKSDTLFAALFSAL